AYAKTDEGRAAPLLAINVRADLPEGVVLVSPPVLTPTFVLTDDGRELSRITGYPGEDFFWVLLAQSIAAAPEAGAAPAPAGQIGNSSTVSAVPGPFCAGRGERLMASGSEDVVRAGGPMPLGENHQQSPAAMMPDPALMGGLLGEAEAAATFLKALGHEGRLM